MALSFHPARSFHSRAIAQPEPLSEPPHVTKSAPTMGEPTADQTSLQNVQRVGGVIDEVNAIAAWGNCQAKESAGAVL